MSSPSTKLGTADTAAKVRAVLAAPEGPTPSVAVGVFKDGETEFVSAGLADIANGRLPDADTIYYAGSVAKQFTALAVIQLVVAGKVGLGRDIRKYIPEMPRRSPAITVDMLLHHISGLPNNAKLLPLAGYRHPGQSTRAETIEMLIRYPQTAFPPGATFEYSNGGYLLLSELVDLLFDCGPFGFGFLVVFLRGRRSVARVTVGSGNCGSQHDGCYCFESCVHWASLF